MARDGKRGYKRGLTRVRRQETTLYDKRGQVSANWRAGHVDRSGFGVVQRFLSTSRVCRRDAPTLARRVGPDSVK
eukprot:13195687-Alexandrium_andersonii.AAC.1